MIQAALLSNLGVGQLDVNGHDVVSVHDQAAGLSWFMLIYAEPGGPVVGNVIRLDPGTMGRGLFHFHAAPRDGRHSLAYPCSGEGLASPVLPPLPALCAFIRAIRAEMSAGRAPDLAVLTPLHLGVAQVLPPVELRPGDCEFLLEFGTPDDD